MFLPNTAGLPQNSLDPPTAAEVAAANRRLYDNFQASRTGRERVYADLPAVETMWDEAPGLAKDASYIIPASELARRSVLNGLTPTADYTNSGTALSSSAPVIYSLNAPATSQNIATSSIPSSAVSPQQTVMPAVAPIPSPYGYLTPPVTMTAAPAPIVRNGEGSGCPGLSGVTPPWSDAFITAAAGQESINGNSRMPYFVLAVVLLAGFTLTQMGEGRKRYA